MRVKRLGGWRRLGVEGVQGGLELCILRLRI